MNIMHTILAILMLMIGSQTAKSADNVGNFWRGGGAGGAQCPQFVAAMEKARSFGINSVKYVEETQGYEMYLLGFQTGYNMSTKDTCDIFQGEYESYSLLSWMENYCRQNASTLFAEAVIALSENRHSKRKRICGN